jgi:hypothetical protein
MPAPWRLYLPLPRPGMRRHGQAETQEKVRPHGDLHVRPCNVLRPKMEDHLKKARPTAV